MVSSLLNAEQVFHKERPQKPSLMVIAEGGAITSHESNGVCTPDRALVAQLCRRVPKGVRELFAKNMLLIFPSEGLQTGKDVSLERIAACVARVRTQLEQHSSVIVLADFRKISHYAMGMMLGVSPEELGYTDDSAKQSGRKQSIILAASSHGTGTDSVGVQTTVDDAFTLSADPLMDGRAGVLFGDCLYALSELERKDRSEELQSGFLPIADKNDSHSWQVTPLHEHHIPIGDGSPFTLDPRVQTFVLDQSVDRAEDISYRIYEGKLGKERLQGLVVKSHDFQHPLVSTPLDILQSLDRAGVPTVLLGRKEGRPIANDQDFNHMIDGRHVPSGQAKVMLAHWLQRARDGGLEDVVDIVAFLRQQFAQFPFLSEDSSPLP
ncbi:MAG: hypothetical protein Greene041662_799 [Candidatus Peregrinibacteria bacterium Greene0416_62]|nr:MAG: hypothetical protein Greene041662_799 [Candidatus Peregrinibacteria bacterium Greene0416_62]TSC99009.1 MAG: hypothetical protein Greene101449_758 [Candidatus Peregrinibacteria bacterium Greene1014_49]